MKNLFLIGFLFIFSKISSQNNYSDIETLIKQGSLIDGLQAKKLLFEKYKSDSIYSKFWFLLYEANKISRENEDALSAIDKAISIENKNPVYLFKKGRELNEIDQLDSALKYFNSALNLDEKGEYYYWRGILNQRLHFNSKAIFDYEKALNKSFETPELYNNYAILLAEDKKYKEALAYCNKSLAFNKNNVLALSSRLKIYIALFQVDSACNDSRKLKSLRHKNSLDIEDSICNGNEILKLKFASEINMSMKFFEKAIEGYNNLINNNILYSDAFLNRGFSYYSLNKYEEAKADYIKALAFKDCPRDIILNNLSLVCFDMNDFEGSLKYSNERLKLDPINHTAFIDRGLSYRKLKKYAAAEKDFNSALKLKPDFFRAYAYRAYLNIELKKFQQAYDDAQKSIELNSKYGYGYVVLAQAKYYLNIPDYCFDIIKAKQLGYIDITKELKKLCNISEK